MSKELKAYLVDDTEFIAAYDEQQAKDIHREMTDMEAESVCLADLATEWFIDGKCVGDLSEVMETAKRAEWLGSTEL